MHLLPPTPITPTSLPPHTYYPHIITPHLLPPHTYYPHIITPTPITPQLLPPHHYPHTPITPTHLLPPHLLPPHHYPHIITPTSLPPTPITPTSLPPLLLPHTYHHRELDGVRNATRSVLSTSLNLQTDFPALEALVNYGITVQAVNDVGTGPPSTSVVFTPQLESSE